MFERLSTPASKLARGPVWHWMKAENARAEGDPRAPWRLFWVAFLIRVAYMTLAHTYRVRPLDDHFHFAWEAGRIARSVVTGHGYGSPFATAWLPYTGPTAWVPPVYPLLIAVVFKLFGVYTSASAWMLLAINCAFSAATALAVWEIAFRCFSRTNAVWSGWLWALYPAAMQYAVRWFWEMSLTTFLFAAVLVLTLRMRGVNANAESPRIEENSSQTRQWLLFGLLWGVIALTTSTLLLFLPVCGLWILIGTRHRPHALRNAVFAGIVCLACLTPWELRNYKVFHAFIPIRGNLGVETYLGNGPGSNGFVMAYDHPTFAPDQLRLYASMGEVRYAKFRGDLARAYIRACPAHFLANTLKRIYFFWVSVPSDARWALELPRVISYSFISLAGLLGLALALYRRVPASGLFAWIFFLLPIPYYTVFVQARFRHPLEPVITVLAVYLFQSATPRHAQAQNV
ncbi:ArnT family glycosyltransferase [Edaphobacter bradus]|uniref:ArnT family glycosyltransferase n=1 Tax=Edaphobacter bradus TaxID=2259016 RepID=UPI0021DF5864|nr:glycosyltransferase family 39 protein [Edaphobacter bradus]